MKSSHAKERLGISLMEVLISIGVIALGIFGVASLIPVAQFKVVEGTSNDRQASLGPSAVAQFRIQNMGDPNNWWLAAPSEMQSPSPLLNRAGDLLDRKAYCLDPLGLAENAFSPAVGQFPANANNVLGMKRLGLKALKTGVPAVEVALAREHFFLRDELVFDRPDDQALQPRRQFFAVAGVPTTSVTTASMSWFATLSPTTTQPTSISTTDEFLLSIVIVRDRVPLLAVEEENYALAASTYSGEVTLKAVPAVSNQQMQIADLRIGDWLLLSKIANPNHPDRYEQSKRVFRWTQIIGASEQENDLRSFTVANDDFLRPGEQSGTAVFVRGVRAVYERTIRLEKLRP